MTPTKTYARGAYVADQSPERMTPRSDAWVARVQTPLYDGTVRLVTPHGTEWTAPVTALREATVTERAWYDEHVPSGAPS